MDLMRFTVIDRKGGVSFVAHGDALPALVAACARNPSTLEHLLDLADHYYKDLKEYVLSSLAVFDEHNAPGRYEAIHRTLAATPPQEQPPFRIVDDVTREASLRPVKAGAILFNLRAKRIVQIVNTYREIRRSGRARIFDGQRLTNSIFNYRLPADWALVP